MNANKNEVNLYRRKLEEKLRNFAPDNFTDRFMKICLGLVIFGFFPLMSVYYPSAMFLANTMLGLYVLIRLAEVFTLVGSLDLLKRMPTDVRKMHKTLMGYQTNMLGHIIGVSAFVWFLACSGFPVFAGLIALLSILAVVLNTKTYNLCEAA